MDFYFNLYNISPKTTNKINTTQGDGETGGQKRKRTFTVGGKGRVSKPQTSHPALVPKPEPSPLLSGGETVAPSGAARIGRAAKPPKSRRPFGETGGQKRKRTFTVGGRVGCQNPKLHTRPLCPNLNPALSCPAGKLSLPREQQG